LERLIMKNQRNQKNNMLFRTIMIIAIVIVLNLIFSNFYWHGDLTENNIYSLSPVTKKILNDLDDLITVKVYFSKDLPTNLALVQTEVKDLLSDFSNYSGGRIKIDFKDPAENDETINEVNMLGIPKLQFNTVSNDEYSITEGYLGMALFFEDHQEVLPVVQSMDNLEYELVRLIKRLQKDQPEKIYFVTGHGEIDLDTDLKSFKEILGKQYTISNFDLVNAQSIPEDVNTLVIAGPQQDFSDHDLYLLDQFLMRQGSLLVLNEGVQIDDQLMATPSAQDNLLNFLSHYGIKINKNLVLDSSRAMAPFSSGFITFSIPYPFWPKITQNGFNSDNVMVNKLESLVLAWASSLELSTSDENTQIIPLITSSPKSWTQEKNYNLDPNAQYDFNTLVLQSRPLAGFVSGQADSYFQDKEKPNLGSSAENNFINSTEQARILVVGDSDFMKDYFLRSAPENLLFAQNIIDGLSQDSDLINIRSREITDRPLVEFGESQKNFWKYFNIFATAILVILYGIGRSFLRKKSNFEDKLI